MPRKHRTGLSRLTRYLAGRNLTTQEWQKYLLWAGHEHTTCAQYPLP